MKPFTFHILLCGGSACGERDASDVRRAFREELDKYNLTASVRESKVTCLDLCACGPNMVVYPDGVWYSGVSPRDAREIVRSHLQDGKPVERLQVDWDRFESK